MIHSLCRLTTAIVLLSALPAWAQRLQSEVPHDTAIPPASMMVITGCEAKDQDGAALPRAVSAEGDAVRCAATLSGVSYQMIVNEDGSLLLHQVEDAAHVSGHLGIMALGVQNATHTTALSGTDGDYTPLAVDSTGKLGIRGTFTEDTGHTTADLGLFTLCVRNDTAGALAGTDLDYIPCTTDASGNQRHTMMVGTTQVGIVDNAGFTDGTSVVLPAGFIFDEVAGTALTENDVGAGRIDSKRAMIMVIEDATTRGTRAAVTATGLSVDTELPAAAALADAASAAPTTPTVGAIPLLMNATTVDRQRAVVNTLNSPGTGIAAVGIVGQFDDTAPTTITENQFGPARMSSNRNLYETIRDAAGNERGANVNASNELTVSAAVTSFPDNEPFNLAQVAGTATLTGGSAGSLGVGGLAGNAIVPAGNPVYVGGLSNSGATIQVARYDLFWNNDGQGATNIVHSTASAMYVFNGTTMDRQRSGSATSTQPHYATGLVHRAGGAFTFLASTTHASTTVLAAQTGLGGFNNLVVTWDVTVAERDSANETYDLYVTCGDGVSTWDVAHFPQIITTGAKRYTAFIHGQLLPQNVTTAVPGAAANEPGTFKTDTASADQGTRTLVAGVIRHGALGDRCGADIVIAGTIATGITHSITMTMKP